MYIILKQKYIMAFLSMFECPLTKSTSSSSFENRMDIEINQKTKYKENTFYALHNV